MAYYIAHIKGAFPSGVRLISSFDYYSVVEVNDPSILQEFSHEEISEAEATIGIKFYGEIRPYRSAYSDVENLEPDPEALANGKRKTKVYHTHETYNATLTLMKRIFKRNIMDVFAEREDKSKEQEILNFIDSLSTIREISYHRERLLGIEMTKTQLNELYLWDNETNSRKGRHHFLLGV
jgi:hypothetical protein